MSEKHDPAGGASRDDAETNVGGEPNPFAISPGETTEDLGDTSLFERSATPDEPIPDLSSATLFEDDGPISEPSAKAAPLVPPTEVDSGVQELQARPADLGARDREPPKTIMSEAEPVWPTWTDGGLPPLIIYGPTSFRRTPAHVPLEPATPEPTTPQTPVIEPEPAVSAIADVPTLPAGSAASAEPAELDEIFDSIEAIAGPETLTPGPTAPDDPFAVPAYQPPATLMTDLPNKRPLPETPSPISGPATMSGHWPPVPSDPERVPPMTSGPATMSGQWPPAPMTDDFATPGPATLDTVLPEEPSVSEPISIESSLDDLENLEAPIPVSDSPEMPELAIASSEPQTMALSAAPFQVEPIPVAAAAVGAAAGLAATGRQAPVPAHAQGYPGDASHGQTASEFFAHAHEDVEKRRGILSLGLLTRLAGLSGLLACAAGLAILVLACAGMQNLSAADIGTLRYGLQWGALYVGGFALLLVVGSLLFKSWRSSAVLAVVLAAIMGGGWFALGQFQSKVEGFQLLSVSVYITYVAMAGMGVSLLGGLIEHRRLREETHVLAALFSNVLATVGGAMLWWLSSGATLLGK